ncbi:unnamed protein product [Phytophthora fragariaefolia]|uniref:Unnamed protein product n=1 Tax=Phytophthora fragariaefolia TaxID=1490495 RepID=A0A9W7CY03_9STRA|nr:unnamed protein product [Phytophthora fragariaefolia]
MSESHINPTPQDKITNAEIARVPPHVCLLLDPPSFFAMSGFHVHGMKALTWSVEEALYIAQIDFQQIFGSVRNQTSLKWGRRGQTSKNLNRTLVAERSHRCLVPTQLNDRQEIHPVVCIDTQLHQQCTHDLQYLVVPYSSPIVR